MRTIILCILLLTIVGCINTKERDYESEIQDLKAQIALMPKEVFLDPEDTAALLNKMDLEDDSEIRKYMNEELRTRIKGLRGDIDDLRKPPHIWPPEAEIEVRKNWNKPTPQKEREKLIIEILKLKLERGILRYKIQKGFYSNQENSQDSLQSP